jgi:hypothetical protein
MYEVHIHSMDCKYLLRLLFAKIFFLQVLIPPYLHDANNSTVSFINCVIGCMVKKQSLIPGRDKMVCLFHKNQTSYEIHTASYLMGPIHFTTT